MSGNPQGDNLVNLIGYLTIAAYVVLLFMR